MSMQVPIISTGTGKYDLTPRGHITVPVLKIGNSVLDGVRDTILRLDTKTTSEDPMVVSN